VQDGLKLQGGRQALVESLEQRLEGASAPLPGRLEPLPAPGTSSSAYTGTPVGIMWVLYYHCGEVASKAVAAWASSGLANQ